MNFLQKHALSKSTKLPYRMVEKPNQSSDYVVIHSDLVGPMRTESLGSKSKYFLTYLCSQSFHFLTEKSEQFDKFKKFKSHYELLKNKNVIKNR